MSLPKLLVQRKSAKAMIPTKGSALAAGYDLYSAMEAKVRYAG
jgi:dUTPase